MSVLSTVSLSVCKVLLTALSGVLLFRFSSLKNLVKPTKPLSLALINVALPAMSLVKVGKGLDSEVLKLAWPCLVYALTMCAFGLALGWVVSNFVHRDRKTVVLTAFAFSNALGIPLPILQTLADEYEWLDAEKSYLLIFLYTSVTSGLMWSLGLKVAAGSSAQVFPEDGETSDTCEKDEEGLTADSDAKVVIAQPPITWIKILSPPLIGTILGAFIGLIPPVKELFVDDGPLELFFEVFEMLGDATLPLVLIVVGVSMASGPTSSKLKLKELILIVGIKLLVPALIGFGLVSGLQQLGIVDDTALRFLCLLESCTPTAMSSVVLCELAGKGSDEMAEIIFWEYLCCILTMTWWCSFYIWTF